MDQFFAEADKVSKFNEGALQMLRIHDLQGKINQATPHLLHFFEDERLYGYQIKLDCITQLFVECSSKLKAHESNKGEDLRKEINAFLLKYPIHKLLSNNVSHNPETRLNMESFKIVKEALHSYDILIRGYLEKHGLSAPEGEDLSGL